MPLITIALSVALRVAFVGDSITASHYPEIAAKALHTPLYRYAVPGADTRRIARLLDRALKVRPTHVVLYAGINDCARSPRSEYVSTIYDRVMRLASRVLDAGAVPVIVAPHGLWKKSLRLGVCAEELEFLLDEGVTTNMVLVKTRMTLSDQEGDLEPDFDSGDGLHLNYAGQKRLAALVVAAIESDRDQGRRQDAADHGATPDAAPVCEAPRVPVWVP